MKIHIMRKGVTAVLAIGMSVLGATGAFAAKADETAASPVSVVYKINLQDANAAQNALNQLTSQYGIDLSKLFGGSNINLGQWLQQQPGNWNPGTGITPAPTKPTTPVKPTPSPQPTKPTPTPTQPTQPTPPANGNNGGNVAQSEFATQVVKLVNAERAKGGLSALTSDALLTRVATDKAKDMYDKNYFDHQSPTYGSPFDMMRAYGVQYSYAGENIAKGQRSPEEVMTAWMNSEGHRQNIMNPNFKKIGVAYYNGEWVQEFTS